MAIIVSKSFALILFLSINLTACSIFSPVPSTPRNADNLCATFKEKRGWYNASDAVFKKWGVPVPVQMAIMHQESHFVADAEPSGSLFWGLIPWFSFSSAYGYPQAKDDTWSDYQRKSGNRFAQRDNFADACDFIGWYSQISYKKLGIAKTDAKNLYLAYHEGHGGFQKQTYAQKPWLVNVSNKVAQRAQQFQRQLNACSMR